MVTAVNKDETGRQALSLGAFDYITKPLDLKYLERSLWYKITTMILEGQAVSRQLSAISLGLSTGG